MELLLQFRVSIGNKYGRIGHFAGCKIVSVSLWVILQAGRDTPLKTSSFGIA